jgi:putative DNA primase/helicase
MGRLLDSVTKKDKKKDKKKDDKKYKKEKDTKKHIEEAENITTKNITSNYITKESIKKLNNNEIAENLCEKCVFIFFKESLYYFNGIIYTRLSKHSGMSLLKELLPSEIVKGLSSFDYNEILTQIKINPAIQIKEEDVPILDHLICFRNGVFDLNKKQLKEHSPKNYFFSYINLDYDPKNIKKGYVFEKYLDTCSNGDEHIKNLLLEMIGYIISNSMSAKKIFIIRGERDSGKTTLGNFIQHLIGREVCCNIQPHDFGKRFQTAELLGKKLCFNMEIFDSPIKETGILKQLSGGDMISAEFKNENSFSFRNQAKLLYGCNNLPKIKNADEASAFFSRLIIIPFEYSVPPEEQNKNLINDLIQESNYIVHKSIEALELLRKNNHIFTSCKSIEKVKNKYIESQNNIIEFINHTCILDENSKTHTEVLYKHYIKFCNEKSYTEKEIQSLSNFSNIVANNFNVTKKKWRPDNSKRTDSNKSGFIGIKLKK